MQLKLAQAYYSTLEEKIQLPSTEIATYGFGSTTVIDDQIPISYVLTSKLKHYWKLRVEGVNTGAQMDNTNTE